MTNAGRADSFVGRHGLAGLILIIMMRGLTQMRPCVRVEPTGLHTPSCVKNSSLRSCRAQRAVLGGVRHRSSVQPVTGLRLPDHLKVNFMTPRPKCMIVGNPFWRYPIASIGDDELSAQVSPLIAAIRQALNRPIRIITHVDEEGKVFNCSFFEDEETMWGFLDWYGKKALSPDGELHHCHKPAACDKVLPTPDTLLFGTGSQVLADTRFGEYQLGMAVRYSLWQLQGSADERAQWLDEVSDSEIEQRIAECMHEHDVSYFGRLVMTDGQGTVLTAVRYGSLDDCQRGTGASRDLLKDEVARWFSEGNTIMGTAQRVLEV